MSQRFDHVLDYVDDYFHDVLTPAEDAYIVQHCEQCRICKVALEEAEKRFAVMQKLPPSEASAGLVGATLQRVEAFEEKRAHRKRLLRRGLWPTVAAAALILGIVHLYYLNLSPSPYDLRVAGQARLFAGTDASLRVWVKNEKSGVGVKQVPVQIEIREHDGRNYEGKWFQLVSFTTDEQGTGQPRFRLPDWPDGDYQLRVSARKGGTITRTIKLQRSWKIMVSSDRPVYQPGQEIHVRALTLRSLDLKPVAGQGAIFTISDPKGNIIFKQKDLTSKFGICAIDCPLAHEILEGPYEVQCQVGDTTSKLQVEVKKYVLPKFKVEIAADQPFYEPGKKVGGTIQAAYFFGKPVAEGMVELELRSSEREPKIRLRLSRTTNDRGEVRFDFPPLPADLIGPVQLDLVASLTDSAGQKQTRAIPVLVSADALKVDLIPEAGMLVQGLSNTVYFLVTTPDGRPAKARIVVSNLDKELVTSDLGVASFDIMPSSSEMSLNIKVTGAEGQIVRRDFRLPCGSTSKDFLVRSDKAVYQGGDTVHLSALGGGKEPVFVDLLKDGQTLLTETIAMADGKGECRFDLPAELFGTLQLCAYRFEASGNPIRKTRVLYIRPPSQVRIQTTMDEKEYRPGRQAKIDFALTDKDGKPTPGALSLAAVDEAVFSVLDQVPGQESAFYTVERKLLAPVYAMYPWSPTASVAGAPAERTQWEQALFARTGLRDKRADRDPASDEVGLHTLSASSYAGNAKETAATRARGLKLMKGVWIAVAILAGLLLYAAAWFYLRTRLMIALHLATMPILGFVLCTGSGGDLSERLLSLAGFRHWAEADSTAARLAREADLGVNDGVEGLWRDDFSNLWKPLIKTTGLADIAPRDSTPRLREWFPETLLWRPELITDDRGRASLDLGLADSITTWRLTATAVTADGRLGAGQTAIKVFQPFFVDLNLPVALTRGDEVAVPVVLYSYLDRPQTVKLKLAQAAWFETLDEAEQGLELKPREVRSTYYRLRVKKVGMHELQVTALGSGVSDAIKRSIEVVPDGRRVETVWNGTLQEPARIQLSLPQNAIDGSARLFVKIYPTTFSQLVEGLDAIFRMPSGCFEQTSSTTYPNVLALDYLRRTKKSVPSVEAKAKQFIHLGYQRLLTFEVSGGGFDWFGRPPANRTLTAYGLMEFQDMARVHDVDPRLIERTRKWLLDQRRKDGSWPAERGMDELATTAYIAWAVFGGAPVANAPGSFTRDFLLTHRPETLGHPHVLALVCNALLAIDPSGRDARPYLDRLVALKQTSADGKQVWWEPAAGTRTTFHGSGRAGNVETTALAALALLQSRQSPATASAALTWLIQQKDPAGTWYSTQGTVLALKALLAGTEAPIGDRERHIELAWGDGQKQQIMIPADQAEVMKQVDLSAHLKPGENALTVSESSGTAAGYQVTFRYHEPGETTRPQETLAIQVVYDRHKLEVGDTLKAAATVTNHMKDPAAMVMLDLPVPAGFTVVADDFASLVEKNVIARFDVQPRNVLVYLRDLPTAKPFELRYHLRAVMPVQITVPAARAYAYYDPDLQGFSRTTGLTVAQKEPGD